MLKEKVTIVDCVLLRFVKVLAMCLMKAHCFRRREHYLLFYWHSGSEALFSSEKDKLNLTIEEAAVYSNIGICKIQELARNPKCPFVLYVGRKKFIKRKEFEKFLSTEVEL